ncbi:ATP-dependent RNA helicase DeaD [Bacillus pakistanensis]|uniref:ATP-dependent RNA helicase DeaD n=1 Tax=Rossellomorea pakistanensis TaxID=992288 RepID=A0ABS2N838_9BACI|nr:DEAD/DEAH box helicase [Bacillus pakistanensis]MBM7584016.1 ATP-dependent RNA helicase DeaD [Bacillus pakistanensis]
MHDFLSLGISESSIKILQEYGVVKPTPVQSKAIPSIIEGKNIIAQAQTGTGKTLGFVLPILEKIKPKEAYVQALIITPTRELALQITDEIEKMIDHRSDLDVLAVYGGQDVEKQLKKLKKNVQIVVGTPGRLLDHIGRGTVDLSKLSHLVLDEADQMLHIGFLNEVEEIMKQTPRSRQTMLFSATMPEEIKTLAKKHMHNPEYIQVEKTQGPAQTVKQMAIYSDDRSKQATLIDLIETHRPYLAVVFCRTKRRVSKLYEVLSRNRISCDEIHGDLSQAKREKAMQRFREAEVQVLIATDVAARGLDVDGVTHVFNYDIPQDAESYIHRIGRTGRAGTKGLAITLYSSRERPTLDLIEKELKIRISKQNLGNAKKDQGKSKSSSGKSQSSKRKNSHKKSKPKTTGDSGGRRNRNNKSTEQKRNWKSNDESKKERGTTRKSENRKSRENGQKNKKRKSMDSGMKSRSKNGKRTDSKGAFKSRMKSNSKKSGSGRNKGGNRNRQK